MIYKTKLNTERMQVIQRYKEALSSDPGLSFKDFFSKEKCGRYDTMLDWCKRRGISVHSLKSDAQVRSAAKLLDSRDHISFIQFAPAKAPQMPLTLQGVSITFPDGVNLTLQESSIESVISLLTIYQARQGGASECSD